MGTAESILLLIVTGTSSNPDKTMFSRIQDKHYKDIENTQEIEEFILFVYAIWIVYDLLKEAVLSNR